MKTTEVKSAANRLKKYIDYRKKSRGLDTEVIHTFNSGTSTETSLMLSDIETLLSTVECLSTKEESVDI